MNKCKPGTIVIVKEKDRHKVHMRKQIGELIKPALPLPWQKNLPNLAFWPGEQKGLGAFKLYVVAILTIESQLNIIILVRSSDHHLAFKWRVTLFEFNKAILKKQGAILNDFEKNSTDFEGF